MLRASPALHGWRVWVAALNANLMTPILIGQVQSVIEGDAKTAMQALIDHKTDILALANSLHPKMVARGGGAVDIEVFHHQAEHDGRQMVVMHLLVDTRRDAMGANLVNTMCEGVASLVETLTHGKVFLRILSNLTDRAIARARVRIPIKNLEGKGYSGEQVRDGIVLANDLALADPLSGRHSQQRHYERCRCRSTGDG